MCDSTHPRRPFGSRHICHRRCEYEGKYKHSAFYNRRKVKEEDIPKYGKTIGSGTLIVGISVIISF